MSNVYEIKSSRGALSDYEDKGIPGAFKFGSQLDVRKVSDSISCGQALKELGVTLQSSSASISPSASRSPSASNSPSPSRSLSPSASVSPSPKSPSASVSPSASISPSASTSPSASVSPSSSRSLSPSPSAGLHTVFADLIRFFVKASDGNVYGFGNTGKVYRINTDLYVVQVYDLEKPIVGAAEWYDDSGHTYVFFATRTELHRKELPGNASWNDVDAPSSYQGGNYPKTNLTAADWHTMREAGGSLVIANGSNVALVGYDGSYTNEAVNFIPGNIVKTIVERNGRGVYGTYRAADPLKGINAAIDSEVPLAQVGDNGDIYFANMTDTTPVKRFPGGGKVNPGGVTNEVDQVNFFEWEQDATSWIDKQSVGNLALFGVWGADSGKNGIYSYGRKNKNHPFVLNLDHLMDVDEIGALVCINGITLASWQDGTGFGVSATDTAHKAQGVYEGLDFKSPIKSPEKITLYKMVECFMDPLPAGASVEFHYRMNKTGAFVQAYLLSSDDNSFTTQNGTKAVFRIAAEGEVYEPRVVINPILNQSPNIYRIRTYFD